MAQDLLETLEANRADCVGMAANMIGVNKRIITFDNEGTYMVMFNPEIVKQSGPYLTEEGCLSLTGTRKTKRFRSIKVRYQNEKFQVRLKTFTGWTAQIIQHEIDHCEGIII
ncbi:peptide deformylase [Oscillibacter sp. PC13]|nr:peptide deformylase [Oscillibacter sp. PC13]